LNRSFPLLVSFRTFAPRDFLLGLPVAAVFQDVFQRLCPVREPPALGCGLVPRPIQVRAGEVVTGLQLVIP
jgi:hypothetical protein